MSDSRVRVAVRCRPRSADEKMSNDGMAVLVESDSHVIVTNENDEKSFAFDFAYGPSASQAQLFEDLAEPLVDKALQGFNGTIFAYGQTGSGKTYTMSGQDEISGLIPLAVSALFSKIGEQQNASSSSSTKFLVSVSYLEIYNEVVKDLLNPSPKQLKVREHPEMGIYVEGLAELLCSSADEMQRILRQGNRVRSVAETNANKRSSRSHACFTIRIEKKQTFHDGREEVCRSKLNLVDLAGSERASAAASATRGEAEEKQLRKEGAAINKSLSALGNVINALSKKSKQQPTSSAPAASSSVHVPYRDSKLTRLLQESLGGNSLTVMIATVAPTRANFGESVSTLQFAERAKHVENEARKNHDANPQNVVRELRGEIYRLRKQLDAALLQNRSNETAGSADVEEKSPDSAGVIVGGANEATLQEMEETIANLTRAKQQTWAEKERLSKLFYEERERNLHSEEAIRQSMATLQEEGQEILRAVAQLQSEKDSLAGDYKRSKLAFTSLKKALQQDMQTYEGQLAAYNAGDEKVQQKQLQAMYKSICERKQQLAQRRHEMMLGKKRLRANETALEQHNILAALSRKSSAAIEVNAEEQKATSTASPDEALLKELASKRRALGEEVEEDKKNLELRKSALGSQREYELETELIQANADKRSIQLEAAYLHKIHSRAMSNVRREFKQQQRSDQRHSLHMLREMCECFEDERRAMKAKHDEFAECLAQAVQDIQTLSRENERLRAQLRKATSTGTS